MSGLDIMIAVVVLIGLWRGFQVGLIKTAVGMVGWLIALIAGTQLASSVAPAMAGFTESPALQLSLAFIAVAVVVLAAMHLAAALSSGIMKTLRLGILDKMAGGVFGAAKNTLIILVVMSATAPLLLQMPQWQQSVIAPELLPYAPMAKSLAADMFGAAWAQMSAS